MSDAAQRSGAAADDGTRSAEPAGRSTANVTYTIISADCHGGANHETYREHLDPAWRDEFDAWRGEYSNPFRDHVWAPFLRENALRVFKLDQS